MILKIVSAKGTVLGAVNVYENNYDGEVSVKDTFHCEAVVENLDTIFGTNDSEVVVCINKEVMQLKDLITDAVSFFKMVGESDGLSNKGFDTGEIMTVEYGEKIVQLCKNMESNVTILCLMVFWMQNTNLKSSSKINYKEVINL